MTGIESSLNWGWEEPSLMEMIADKIGVDFNVGWFANDGNQYSITPNGVSKYNPEENSWHYDTYALRDIIVYGLRPRYSPDVGDSFYTIDLQNPNRMVVKDIWSGISSTERGLLKNNLVFRTKGDAEAAVTDMLELLENGYNMDSSGQSQIELNTRVVNSPDDIEDEDVDLFIFDREGLREAQEAMGSFDAQMERVSEMVRGMDGEDGLVFDMEVEEGLEEEIEQHGMTATMDLDNLDSFVAYDKPHAIIEPNYDAGLINRTVIHNGRPNIDLIKIDSGEGRQLLQLSGLPLKKWIG